MADRKVSDKQLIEALLRERDELYRRAVKAERLCGQLSDANTMRQSYEARIRPMMQPRMPPSSTHSWDAANLPAWTSASGWTISSNTFTTMTRTTHETCWNSSRTISKRPG